MWWKISVFSNFELPSVILSHVFQLTIHFLCLYRVSMSVYYLLFRDEGVVSFKKTTEFKMIDTVNNLHNCFKFYVNNLMSIIVYGHQMGLQRSEKIPKLELSVLTTTT